MKAVSTNVRVLNLFFELLGARQGRSRTHIRRLEGYETLTEEAFISAFQRDKDALRNIGVPILMDQHRGDERYQISPQAFTDQGLTLDSQDFSLIRMSIDAWSVSPPITYSEALTIKLRAHIDDLSQETDNLRQKLLMNLDNSGSLMEVLAAVAQKYVISFGYPSLSGNQQRSVEPWKVILRGHALYLWGFDLDREAPRLFRLSRIKPPIDYLGEAGDAPQMSELPPDPFTHLMVSPTLLIREHSAPDVLSRCEPLDINVPIPHGWGIHRGMEVEEGEWLTLIFANISDVVVVAPHSLRDVVLTRLQRAADAHEEDEVRHA